jgi:hypothetical protein
LGATVLVFFLGPLPDPLRWFWFAFVVISAAEIPILLLLSYSDVGIKPPNLDTHWISRIFIWLRWLVLGAATVLLVILWWNCLDTSLTRDSLKTALLMVGIAELATLWSELKSGSGFRDSLIQLRRAIGLGELTVEDAKRRIDEVLHGAVTRQFLAQDLRLFDQALTAYTNAQIAAQTALSAVKITISAPIRSPAETSAKVADLKAQVTSAQMKLEGVRKARQRLSVRAGFVVGQSPNELEEIKGLIQPIETNVTNAAKAQSELKASLDKIEMELRVPVALFPKNPPVI